MEMNKSSEIILRNGVESMLDGSKVSCSNIAVADYTVDGETKKGLTANLALPNQENWLRVGIGSSFELNGKTWVIANVTQEFVSVKHK